MSLTWIAAADYEAMSALAAARIADAIRQRLAQRCPMLLGLATGNTMLVVYEHLARLLNERGTDLAQLHTVNLDEYVGNDGGWVPPEHPLSYHGYMERTFFSRLDPRLGLRREHVHFPDPARPGDLDNMLARMGRLDLQLLGIGFNGHIAFNEPLPAAQIATEAFAALPSRVVDLTELTIETNARLTAGGDRACVPRKAVTLGMRSILAAREILLLACFPEQAAPLGRLLRGRPAPELPASYLLDHPNATIIYAGDRVHLEQGRQP